MSLENVMREMFFVKVVFGFAEQQESISYESGQNLKTTWNRAFLFKLSWKG